MIQTSFQTSLQYYYLKTFRVNNNRSRVFAIYLWHGHKNNVWKILSNNERTIFLARDKILARRNESQVKKHIRCNIVNFLNAPLMWPRTRSKGLFPPIRGASKERARTNACKRAPLSNKSFTVIAKLSQCFKAYSFIFIDIGNRLFRNTRATVLSEILKGRLYGKIFLHIFARDGTLCCKIPSKGSEIKWKKPSAILFSPARQSNRNE